MPHLHLPTLETLDLSRNDIVNVPLELSHNLTNLKKLELANNKLYMIPGTLNAFTKLEYLGISGNPLESLNFQQSFTLREVDLRNVSLDILEVRFSGSECKSVEFPQGENHECDFHFDNFRKEHLEKSRVWRV